MKQNYFMKRPMSVSLLLLMSALSWAYDFQLDDIYYNYNSDSTSVTVTYYDPHTSVIFSPENSYSGDVVIPSSVTKNNKTYNVTTIGIYAFYNCESLTSVVIPNSVKSVIKSNFTGCPSLTSLVIGSGVTNFEGSFSGSPSLASIIVSEENPIYDSRENCNAIILTSSNTLVKGCHTTVIPNSVTSIGDMAFDNCSSLTSIEIPNSVTSIGKGAFGGCSISEITIPNSVTSIGESAFSGCGSLLAVTIPNSVTSFGESAFSYCGSLKNVTIQEGIRSIGKKAFLGCSSLASIIIPNSVQSIGGWAFEKCSSLATVICYAEKVPRLGTSFFYGVPTSEITLYVPASALRNYKTADQWKDFGKILPLEDIPAGINSIGADDNNAPYYTLDGRRVDTPTQKGIYIRNGKKVFVK